MKERLTMEYVPIDSIKPYDKNPRLNDEAVPLLAKSIDDFGFLVPIVVDKKGVIAAGHTRYLASKQLGLSEVPVIRAEHLTPKQIKAYRLADNKVAELAGWDFALLSSELDDLSDDFDMEDYGFILDTYDEGADNYDEDDGMEDEVVVPDPKPRAGPPGEEVFASDIEDGDRVEMGRNVILCGNIWREEVEEALHSGRPCIIIANDPNMCHEFVDMYLRTGGSKEDITVERNGDRRQLFPM